MGNSKAALMAVGVIIAIIGILGIVPASMLGTLAPAAQPFWYGLVELVVGAYALYAWMSE